MHFKAEILLLMVPMVAWVSCQDCKKVELKGYQGTFHSPNYPKHYDHKANCMWIITAPPDTFIHLSFDTFDVKNPFWECTHDYVDIIYDDTKSERFCTDNPPPTTIKSITNILKLSLKSDRFFLNGIGFEATYTVVDSTGKALKQEGDDDQDETTGRGVGTTVTPGDKNKAVAASKVKPTVRKGKKGKKGKRQRKSKELRRKERKLRRQKAKALRRKNRKAKGRKGKKARSTNL